jgi:3-hydroxyacyl-[acyl-carrier-protein] dehydratase
LVADYSRFLDILPQQPPFRMIDEIIDFKEGESLTAVKNLTGNEWVFAGGAMGPVDHFPETLIIEAAAQAAQSYFIVSSKTGRNQRLMLGKIVAEFTAPTRIGQRLIFKTNNHKSMGKSGYMDVHCSADNKPIAAIVIFYGLLD